MIAHALRGCCSSPLTRLRVALLTGLSIGLLSSCSGSASWLNPSECHFEPVPADELPADLAFRARSRFEVQGETLRVELVARAKPDGLTVLGLTNYGVRLFAVEQRGQDLVIDAPSRSERALARFAMDALHRAFWIRPPAGVASRLQGQAQAQESESWEWGGERVSQTSGASGVRRRYESARDSRVVTIDYPEAATVREAGDAPARVVVRNPRCGYDAVIVPLAARSPGPH